MRDVHQISGASLLIGGAVRTSVSFMGNHFLNKCHLKFVSVLYWPLVLKSWIGSRMQVACVCPLPLLLKIIREIFPECSFSLFIAANFRINCWRNVASSFGFSKAISRQRFKVLVFASSFFVSFILWGEEVSFGSICSKQFSLYFDNRGIKKLSKCFVGGGLQLFPEFVICRPFWLTVLSSFLFSLVPAFALLFVVN